MVFLIYQPMTNLRQSNYTAQKTKFFFSDKVFVFPRLKTEVENVQIRSYLL